MRHVVTGGAAAAGLWFTVLTGGVDWLPHRRDVGLVVIMAEAEQSD